MGERDRGSAMADWPGRWAGESPCPPSDMDNQSMSRAGGEHEMVGNGRVSFAMAHLSKRRHGERRGNAIANRPPDAGYGRPRPAVGCGQTISQDFSALLVPSL